MRVGDLVLLYGYGLRVATGVTEADYWFADPASIADPRRLVAPDPVLPRREAESSISVIWPATYCSFPA